MHHPHQLVLLASTTHDHETHVKNSIRSAKISDQPFPVFRTFKNNLLEPLILLS
jgi:hypothetical protein